ncbi:unnamed protein product [Microthlaspi erraticum]|uniref:Uncharacterized protein n=1 Tax=Microthlaspi erraticum TaxID=1685480 RepID=A0A6D2JYV2_9BRAS|nr:unnamed protein product [Microthlaspi erraticum]
MEVQVCPMQQVVTVKAQPSITLDQGTIFTRPLVSVTDEVRKFKSTITVTIDFLLLRIFPSANHLLGIVITSANHLISGFLICPLLMKNTYTPIYRGV